MKQAISDTVPALQGNILLVVSNNGTKKKDLVQRFEEMLVEFRKESVNGSIALHFSEGYLAKIHATRVE